MLDLLQNPRLKHLASVQLGQQLQHLVPILCQLLRPKLQPQRRRMLVLQLAQSLQRIVVATLVEQQFRLRHEPQVAFMRSPTIHLTQIFVACMKRPQLMCRPGRHDKTQADRLVVLQRLFRCTLGATKATLEESPYRLLEGTPRTRAPLLAPERDRPSRHCKRKTQRAHQKVSGDKRAKQ